MKYTLLSSLILLSITPLQAQDNYYYKNNKKIYLTPANTMTRAKNKADYYHTPRGYKVGVYTKIIVKVKEDIDIISALAPYNLAIEKRLAPRLYLVSTPTRDLTLDIANRLAEQDFIEYAHPDFIKQTIQR